jgi:hypothetical protein
MPGKHARPEEGTVTAPQYASVDTPEGKLELTWPRPEIIWDLEGPHDPEPVIWDGPYRPPIATLNGKEITADRAREILRAMADMIRGRTEP